MCCVCVSACVCSLPLRQPSLLRRIYAIHYAHLHRLATEAPSRLVFELAGVLYTESSAHSQVVLSLCQSRGRPLFFRIHKHFLVNLPPSDNIGGGTYTNVAEEVSLLVRCPHFRG